MSSRSSNNSHGHYAPIGAGSETGFEDEHTFAFTRTRRQWQLLLGERNDVGAEVLGEGAAGAVVAWTPFPNEELAIKTLLRPTPTQWKAARANPNDNPWNSVIDRGAMHETMYYPYEYALLQFDQSVDLEYQLQNRAASAGLAPYILHVEKLVDRTIFVMERIVGESLQTRLTNDGNFLCTKVKTRAKALLKALRTLDAAGIRHGDLNSHLHNIMVETKTDAMYFIDFGMAAALMSGASNLPVVIKGVCNLYKNNRSDDKAVPLAFILSSWDTSETSRVLLRSTFEKDVAALIQHAPSLSQRSQRAAGRGGALSAERVLATLRGDDVAPTA